MFQQWEKEQGISTKDKKKQKYQNKSRTIEERLGEQMRKDQFVNKINKYVSTYINGSIEVYCIISFIFSTR